MNTIQTKNQTLTVKEFSRITGISERTIQRYLNKYYPYSVSNGTVSYLNEEMMTRVKMLYERSGRMDIYNVKKMVNKSINDGLMTIREFSELSGISRQTISNYIKELYPETVSNGKATYLNEQMITKIKMEYERSGRRDLLNVQKVQNINTDLEMMAMTRKVLEWNKLKIDSLTKENKDLRTQNRNLDFENEIKQDRLNLLTHSKRTYTATDIAKELGFTSAKAFNQILVNKKIMFRDKKGDLQPTYKYSDKGYFQRKQEILSGGKEVYYTRFTQKGREWVLNILRLHIVK